MKGNCAANRCKYKRLRSLSLTRGETCILCQQSTDRDTEWICGNRIESLAVAWAVEKFHHFLYGCHFTLETDQKPVEAILSRSLNQAMPRLQCTLIRTLAYNFTVRYIPGPQNLLADCLSRLGDQRDTIKLPKLHVYQISQQLPARSDRMHELQQAA